MRTLFVASYIPLHYQNSSADTLTYDSDLAIPYGEDNQDAMPRLRKREEIRKGVVFGQSHLIVQDKV